MRRAALALPALCWAACAAAPVRPAPGSGGELGAPVPLLVEVHSWDEAFDQLVSRCPAPVDEGATLDPSTAFTLLWLGASVGAGAYAVAHRQIDLTTGLAIGVGAAAVAGQLYEVVTYLRGRSGARRAFEDQRARWREAWARDPAGRPELARTVAGSCGEEATLQADVGRLGPVR